eukprot:scaffold101_cov230-Pinguiococcus_pyrenoidosus.AAC.9
MPPGGLDSSPRLYFRSKVTPISLLSFAQSPGTSRSQTRRSLSKAPDCPIGAYQEDNTSDRKATAALRAAVEAATGHGSRASDSLE